MARFSLINRVAVALLCAAALIFDARLARAHETDQFSMPPRREFADWGPYFNRFFYDAIDRGVQKTNQKIRAAIEGGQSPSQVAALQSTDEVTVAVSKEFPIALNIINGLDKMTVKPAVKQRYPGRVTGDRPVVHNVRQHFEIPFNPLRPWYASTVRLFDTHLGGDKIGHFSDMGMIYWRKYDKARSEGKNAEDAVKEAVSIGTHGFILSERGILGYVTAGAYSNADLVANFLGMQFYRNLTEPVVLNGELRPPMLVRDGDYWILAGHVGRDSGFFRLFISDHLNEALNPSVYLAPLRGPLQKAVRERTSVLLARHADRHGNRRPPQYFDRLVHEYSTYYGIDYGHNGSYDDVVSIGKSCFAPAPKPGQKLNLAGRDANGLTPLHRAAWYGSAEAVRDLLDRGADPNAQVRSKEVVNADWGETPLHLAAGVGRADVVQMLLDAGADPNARDDRNVTPLHRAADHADVVKLLLSHGADAGAADVRGRSVLQWASDGNEKQDNTDVIDLILAAGANINASDHEGHTPLQAAARAGNKAAVACLLQHGADVNRRDHFGATALHLAAARQAMPLDNRATTSVVSALIDAGADVAARDDFGCTPLHDAARAGPKPIVTALLNAGALPDVGDDYGTTPLHLACRGGREEIAQALLDGGADVNIQNASGSAPLHEAAACGDMPLVQLLLAHKAQPTVRNINKATPAEVASSKGYAVIEKLIRNPG